MHASIVMSVIDRRRHNTHMNEIRYCISQYCTCTDLACYLKHLWCGHVHQSEGIQRFSRAQLCISPSPDSRGRNYIFLTITNLPTCHRMFIAVASTPQVIFFP